MVASPALAADQSHLTLHAPVVIAGLAGAASSGTTSTVTVTYSKQGGAGLGVEFRLDGVGGSGDQWRAAGWDAATVATLVDNAPRPAARLGFDVHGRLDGPSAGALMTVGVLALMRGDRIKPHITMTGAISPDGTVGPVQGIPEKVDVAMRAGAKTLLIPLGQAKSADAGGKIVDVVALGAQKRLRVVEVGDIYAAYKAFTGKALPRPKASNDVALTGVVAHRVEAKVTAQLAAFDASVADFGGLPPAIQSDLGSFSSSAAASHAQAQQLAAGEMPAGAFLQSLQAAATMSATVKTGRLLGVYLTQGAAAFADQVKSSSELNPKLLALVAALKKFTPKTLSDAAALVEAYGSAVDAISTSHAARDLLAAAGGQTDPTQALKTAILGAVLYELTGAQVQGARDVFEIGTHGPGARISTVKVGTLANLFRNAATANLRSFDSLIVNPHALPAGIDAAAVRASLGQDDFGYALAESSQRVLNGGLTPYFGSTRTADYATLGAALRLYTRATQLVSKYTSLGNVNPDLEVTGISNDQALQSALDLGRNQTRRGIGVLRSRRVSPTLVIGSYEVAGAEAPGPPSDALAALAAYRSAFVGSRVLTYLGGFPTTGTKESGRRASGVRRGGARTGSARPAGAGARSA